MVGYDPKDVLLTKSELAFASTASGVLSRMIIQPFDVLKIRFQVQHEPISRQSQSSKYKSLFQAVKTILREEGVFSFWKGHLTGQILSATNVMVQFTSFEMLTKFSYYMTPVTVDNDKFKTATHFVCGGLSASVAALVNQPIDTLRTRFVTQGEPKVYKSIPHACSSLYKAEGLNGFFKGLVPSIALVAPQAAITFSLYSALNSYWDRVLASRFKDDKGLALKSSVNGAISGVVGKSLIYPFDVIKKRLQIQGFEEARSSFGLTVKYTGLIDCFQKLLKQEGVPGLYKGYWPSALKAAVSSGSIFFFYDEITHAMRVFKTEF